MGAFREKEILKVGLFYPDLDKEGGYPRDVLRLFKELESKDGIKVKKIKSLPQLLVSLKKLDCVHVFGFFSFKIFLTCLLCIVFNKKYIVSVFGQLLPGALSIGKLKKIFFINCFGRFILRRASKIHVFTDYEAKELIKYQISTPTFKSFFGIYPEDVKNTQEIMPLVMKKPFLLFFGRLDIHQKGLNILLEGFKKYSIKSEMFDLVISGRNYNNGNLYIENFLRKNNSKSRIHFLGEVTEVEKEALYSYAAAIIYPCHFDGNPRPLRHALCRKKKILTTFQTNFADQLEPHNWGVLFENTSLDLAEGIEKFEEVSTKIPYEEPSKTRSWDYCSNEFMVAYAATINN
ncbi:glycosyltransferase [Maribacter algarum]|uniref:Glycosyltransferase n=1 Tax=Maribacter algarum (ex Zhang et al. 2020) TaxID=2578118 RepID=A0A5S3PT77_9FLAO|nr:glycosyltransferase [Maribacter algarum]TMM58196.1 glycosyltransferase [Maribacter algarum]